MKAGTLLQKHLIYILQAITHQIYILWENINKAKNYEADLTAYTK